MDLLTKELERKKKALQHAKRLAAVDVLSTASRGSADGRRRGGGQGGERASSRFLNAAQLRKRQEEEESSLKRLASSATTSSSSRTMGTKRARSSDLQIEIPLFKKETAAEHTLESSSAPTATATSTMYELKNAQAVSVSHSTSQRMVNGDPSSTMNNNAQQDMSSFDQPLNQSDHNNKNNSHSVSVNLRSLGLPVRLFGEIGDTQRLERLRTATAQQQLHLASWSEKQEFRLGQGHGIRNPFLHRHPDKNAAAVPAVAGSEFLSVPTKKSSRDEHTNVNDDHDMKDKEDDEQILDLNDPHHRVYKYFHSLLQQWQDELLQRPLDVRLSVSGKKETNTVQQCKDYIAPLFKLLKKRTLEASLTEHLTKIVTYCQQGEFVSANDAYMDVAIGRAAWPIGVTMVGIHARTGRSKIESANVAHVMNSELQRKYLTSVKRLMTFAQAKSDAHPSKKVLN